ncbi:hypothetical protein QTN47_23850 [Danxiaibacter flavus]|uniref:DUF3108 domain-containing protein n=1 Tax=Danxiaibacter flavus TaxID=3049108 RepID=A0ABV3ZKZ9_9BACT|nr:hypothetical protein QNM32_23855 [Chitinophagaceae bacterium DXS]
MKKLILVSSFLMGKSFIFAQKSAVIETFKKYNISTIILDSNAKQNAADYSYTVHATLITGGQKKVTEEKYHPAKNAAERWELVSVNGGAPSKTDKKLFNKEHNQQIPIAKPDSTSYRILKDDADYLIVSYHYDTSTLVADNNFMKDFPVTLYINKKNGRLERSEVISEEPFKVKVFKADYMMVNTTYIYIEKTDQYLPLQEETTMSIRILGRNAEIITSNEYSNYKK